MINMKTVIFLLFPLFLSHSSFSQTGLFGRYNSVEFRYNMAPSLERKGIVKHIEDDTIVVRKLRYVNSSYTIKYNRIISNRFSIGLGIDMASMVSKISTIQSTETKYYPLIGSDTTVRSYRRIIEPRINYKGLTLEFSFFGSTGINPIGLRSGFSLDFGQVVSDYSHIGVFESITTINNVATVNDQFHYYDFEDLMSTKRSVFNLRVNLGKSIMITRRLLFNIDFNYSVLTAVFNHSDGNESIYTYLRPGSNSNYYEFAGFDTNSDPLSILEQDSYRITLGAYKKITLNLGVSYAF